MSGQDDRARQFKEAADSKLKGDPLAKEITALRRFLFRNQDYRFTKSAQTNLYAAVRSHHTNAAAFEASGGEAPILKLLDDALKMPFTVFTSAQKDRLLQLYWALLGTTGEAEALQAGRGGTAAPAQARTRWLMLMDVAGDGTLSLAHYNGSEYPGRVAVADAVVLARLRDDLDSGASITVTVAEAATDSGEAQFVGYAVDEE